MQTLPELATLYLRHPGITKPLSESLAEAAAVCFSRHHTAPISMEVRNESVSVTREVTWKEPDARELAAWNNQIDTTELGACGVSLAAVESELGLFAVSRADVLTGADYYVAAAGTDSLENARRLEVSGVDRGDEGDLQKRVRLKIAQVKKPSDESAIVSVVGFRARVIRIERVT